MTGNRYDLPVYPHSSPRSTAPSYLLYFVGSECKKISKFHGDKYRILKATRGGGLKES